MSREKIRAATSGVLSDVTPLVSPMRPDPRAPTSKRSVELSRAARGSASSAARYIQLANL